MGDKTNAFKKMLEDTTGVAGEVPRGLHCIAPHILLPSYCDQVVKRGLTLNFSTHVLLGDVPGRLAPLRKRGERLLFADEPD